MKQTKTITVVFDTKHVPGDDEHLNEVLRGYFKSKGVRYDWGVIIV